MSGFHHLYWKSQKYRLWLDGLETSPSSLGSLLKRLYTGCALFCFPVNSFETNPKVINFPQYFAETFSVTLVLIRIFFDLRPSDEEWKKLVLEKFSLQASTERRPDASCLFNVIFPRINLHNASPSEEA